MVFHDRPFDAAGNPSHFFCGIVRKDVCGLTHGPYEILQHLNGARHFPSDQRLQLETPDWRVLDFDGNPLSDGGVERRSQKILPAPFVKRDRDHMFTEDWLVDESGAADPILPVLVMVSSVMEILQPVGICEVVEMLWSPFMLFASQVDIEVAWS